jgi:hypothetical protein
MRKLAKRTALLAILLGAAGAPALAQTTLYPGIVKAEVFTGIGGTAIVDLTGNPKYPNNPDIVAFPKFLEYPTGADDGTAPPGNVMANYGVKVSGVITPKETAKYVFYLAADDNAQLFLSTDATPANKQLIAWEPQWNPVRAFSAVDRRPGCDAGDCENVSTAISLTANTSYYFEALMKEGGGGDNLAVAWTKEGEAAPDNTALPIGAEFLGVNAPNNVAITSQPKSTAGLAGQSAIFRVGINGVPGAITYQWKKNGADITGATSATYSTPALTAADEGAKFSVEVKGPNNTVTSTEASVGVVSVTEKTGVATVDVFTDIAGTAVTDLTSNSAYPSRPSRTEEVKFLEYPPGADDGTPPAGNVYANYGIHVTGFIVPTTTADYTFYLAADDGADFFLSTDANPANKALVAWEPTWNPVRAFDAIDRRPGCDAGDCENISTPIRLTANQPYFFEGHMKEGGGGDNFAVGWSSDGSVPTEPIPGQFLKTVVPTNSKLAEHPTSISVEENRKGTFSVSAIGVGGYTYQWQSAPAGGSTFTDVSGATGRTLEVTATVANSGTQYRAVVKAGTETLTSEVATLTTTPDVTGPTIVATGSNPGGVLVYFSEPVGPGANVGGNYTLSGGVTVSGATQVGPSTVALQTGAPLTAGTDYTLTVNNVKDAAIAGGNLVSPNTATVKGAAALPTPLTEGLIKYERWENLSPSDIPTALARIADTAAPPEITETVVGYEAPVNVADNYAGRLSGWFYPPADGDYVFAGTSDDNGRLFLSTDSDPANKKLIALQPNWDNFRIWTSGFAEKHSDTYAGTEWPTKSRISLKGGQPYYLEYIWQEGGGGDDGAVTFWKLGDPVPANNTPTALSGAVVKGNVPAPIGGPPLVTAGPKGVTFNKGDTLTFNVTVIGAAPFQYQWFRNKKPIAGATSATLTISNADHTAVGDYNVHITNAEGEADSGFRGGDDAARAIMNGAFVIEAEDYNYEGGKHVAASDTMPLSNSLYQGLKPTDDIDFWANGNVDTADAGAYAYGRHVSSEDVAHAIKGPGDPADFNRGSYTITQNYAVGWTDQGEWMNYTRVFPKGKYVIINAAAHDGVPDLAVNEVNQILSKVANPTVADGSSSGAEGGQQGLTKLGTFLGPATGAWSSNDLIPLTDDNGNIVQVDLDGATTLRLTFNELDGDADFFLFYCLDCAAPTTQPRLSITRNGNSIVISSDVGATIQKATSLTNPTWTPLGTAPQTVTADGAAAFFRGVAQ